MSNSKSFELNKSKLRRGLTLVELAIVVLMLGVIFTGIFGAYYIAWQITRPDPGGGVNQQSILFAMDNVRSTFSQTFFIPNNKRLVFISKTIGVKGEKRDHVVFAANHPNSDETGSPAVREVAFYLKSMSGTSPYYSLIRREDEMVDAFPLKGGTEHVLLDYVKSFQLMYSSKADEWEEEWDSRKTQKIPRLIRIEIIAMVGKKEVKYEGLCFPGIYNK